MMQNRDFYSQDYIYKHIKLASLTNFQEHMFNPARHQKQLLLFTPTDMDKQVNLYSFYLYSGLFTLSSSVLAIALYKKLPYLNRVEKRYKRVLIKLAMFFIPVQIVSAFGQQSQSDLSEQQFNKYSDQFQQYLYTGNVCSLKPDIKLSEV